MRLRILISSTLATLVIVPALILSAHTHAAVMSSIEGGDIYRVKNVTKGTDFSDPNNADACDLLQYKVRLHNGGPTDVLNDVTVQAAFPTGASTKNVSLLIARASNASPSSTSDNATVNLSSSQSLSYVSSSTQLLDASGNVITALPDGITGAGVNIGQSLGISINEMRFVQFEEKVSCPTPPPPNPVFTCDKLDVSVGDNRTVKITTFDTTATNGAVFNNAVIDWGDNSSPLTSATPVGQTHQYAADGTFIIAATAHFTVDGQDKTADGPGCKATVKITTPPPPPNPVFTCDKLDVATEGDRTVKITTFDTTAKNGATFKDAVVDWGDNSSPLTSANPVGQTHQFAKDGTFTIAATAHFTVDGQDKTADGPSCTKKVTFTTPPPASPVFSCDKLTVEAGDNRTVKITTFDTTAKNGATFKNAVVDWGDNSSPLTTAKPVGESHQYGQDGTFTVVATAHFTANGKDVTANGPQCTQMVIFTPGQPPVVTPPPTTPPSTTTTTTTTPGSTETVTSAASPTELVNTGPGSLIGLFVGVSIVGTVAYHYVLSRRLSRD